MIFANLVSFDGTNATFDASAVLEPVMASVVAAVTAFVVLGVIWRGVIWIFRAIRGDDSDYIYGDDHPEESAVVPLGGSGLAPFQTSEKAMAYYAGKPDMYVWDGNSNMGTQAGPKGPLP